MQYTILYQTHHSNCKHAVHYTVSDPPQIIINKHAVHYTLQDQPQVNVNNHTAQIILPPRVKCSTFYSNDSKLGLDICLFY